jgi:hypothetical protein
MVLDKYIQGTDVTDPCEAGFCNVYNINNDSWLIGSVTAISPLFR